MSAVEPSAVVWLRRLAARELSARELAEHYLERMRTVDGRLGAIVSQEPEVTLEAADRADADRAAGIVRPLLGLPLTVKDCIEVAGFTCAAGSVAREGFRPRRDATVVARLREAGAAVLAKSNTPEYVSSYETENAVNGRTNHPLDPARTPGGSSGGEGALLGADASPAGIGSDGGGSIRVPAHYCGLVGLRPTAGRVPETGTWPSTRASGMMDMHTLGPMARFVEDLPLLLAVISGPDGVDPYAVPVPLGDWRAVDVAKLRVGFYVDDGLVAVTPPTRAAVERAARALGALGCEVEEASPPQVVAQATSLFFAASGADGGAKMRADVAAAAGRHHQQFATLLSLGADAPPPSAADAFATIARVHDLRAQVRAYLSTFDVVLAPVVAGPAPLHGTPPAGLPQEAYFAYEAFNFTHTYSLAGTPAAVVPAGTEDGLPIGVQILAGPFADDVALATAGALERELGGFAGLREGRR